MLDEDADLADAISVNLRERAVRECLSRTLLLRRGTWTGAEAPLHNGGIGLLVLDGLLIQRVHLGGRRTSEVLGEGDLLRPQPEHDSSTLLVSADWHVIEPTRMALLDRQFALRASRYPELTGRLVERSLQRSYSLAVNMAIVQQPRVDVRLHMLLWHFAGRWGRVRTDAVSVPLRLTHSILAGLVAARRPTVTTALSELTRQGLVCTTSEGWLLYGSAPRELSGLAQAAHRSEQRAA